MAYAALLLYVAILFVRPQEWVTAIYGWPVLDVVVGVALVSWVGSLSRRNWRLRDAPQNWLMLGLFIAALMSHVRHTFLAMFIETFQDFGKIVLLYFLIVTLVDSVSRTRTVIALMILGCLFMAAHGILQWHTGAGFGGAPPIETQGAEGTITRVVAFGMFHDPNDLALMLVAVLPFLFSTVMSADAAGPRRVLSLGATVPILYCIYLTNSRGGWLALGVMAVAYSGLHLRNKKIAVALAVVCFAAIVALGPSRMRNVSMDDPAARERVMAWGEGNAMLKQWPIFGAGKGRFAEFADESRVAHNSFVHCWAELGLFGYFFWVGMIVASLKDGRALGRISSEEPEAREIARLAKAAMASLVGFLAAAFFLSRTYIMPLYLLFALFACLRAIHERNYGPLESGFVMRQWRYVLAAEMLSIPALYVMMKFPV